MAIASHHQVQANIILEGHLECAQALGHSNGDAPAAPVSNLAALLDQFTQSVTQPNAHTVGAFAANVDALQGELALLARHFGAKGHEAEAIDFDDIFPHEGELSKDYEGLAAEEALEHVCRELSR